MKDREVWLSTVHGVAESDTTEPLKNNIQKKQHWIILKQKPARCYHPSQLFKQQDIFI